MLLSNHPRVARALPGSNAGCGLKPCGADGILTARRITRQQCRVWIETSRSINTCVCRCRITRQQCRVWIETPSCLIVRHSRSSITRQQCRVWIETRWPLVRNCSCRRITRQQCRVWIETSTGSPSVPSAFASPGSNAGCGLKPLSLALNSCDGGASPGSNAGCGLKPDSCAPGPIRRRITRQQCRVWIETMKAGP